MKIVTTLFPAFLTFPLPSSQVPLFKTNQALHRGRAVSNPDPEPAPAGGANPRKEFSLLPVHLLFREGGAERVPGREDPVQRRCPSWKSARPAPAPTSPAPGPACANSTTGLNKEKETIRRRKEKQNQTKTFPCNVKTYNSYPRCSIETSMLWEKQVNWKHESVQDSFKTKNGKKNVHELSLPPKQIHFRNSLPFHDINTQETKN